MTAWTDLVSKVYKEHSGEKGPGGKPFSLKDAMIIAKKMYKPGEKSEAPKKSRGRGKKHGGASASTQMVSPTPVSSAPASVSPAPVSSPSAAIVSSAMPSSSPVTSSMKGGKRGKTNRKRSSSRSSRSSRGGKKSKKTRKSRK